MGKATYVVAGLNGFYATSKDGKRWKENTGREGNTYNLITFGEEECLISGTRGRASIFTYSKNGSKWDTTYKNTGWRQSPKMAFKYKGKIFKNHNGAELLRIFRSDTFKSTTNSNTLDKIKV